MSYSKLSASQVLKRTEIDLVASAGTKSVRAIPNLNMLMKRTEDEPGTPKVVIIITAALAVAALVAASMLAVTLIS